MNCDYHDITSRIPDPPTWWDEYAVPRWVKFSPDVVADIYAREVALVEIACQNCRRVFRVAFSWSGFTGNSLSEHIHQLHYGDPPNEPCCMAGPTMNSVPLRVVEFWQRSKDELFKWVRRKDLEVPIECDWAKEWAGEICPTYTPPNKKEKTMGFIDELIERALKGEVARRFATPAFRAFDSLQKKAAEKGHATLQEIADGGDELQDKAAEFFGEGWRWDDEKGEFSEEPGV